MKTTTWGKISEIERDGDCRQMLVTLEIFDKEPENFSSFYKPELKERAKEPKQCVLLAISDLQLQRLLDRKEWHTPNK